MDLPEVTEVKRLTLYPGDRLVVVTDELAISYDQADGIRDAVQRALNTEVPVVVFPRGWRLEVLNEEGAGA